MITNDKLRYFIVVRLFPDWKSKLELFGACSELYRSMRLEINPMDFDETGDTCYQVWLDRYKLRKDRETFDTLIKSDLNRAEMQDLVSKLRTAIYQDSDETEEVTYTEWMEGYKSALNELKPITELL